MISLSVHDRERTTVKLMWYESTLGGKRACVTYTDEYGSSFEIFPTQESAEMWIGIFERVRAEWEENQQPEDMSKPTLDDPVTMEELKEACSEILA